MDSKSSTTIYLIDLAHKHSLKRLSVDGPEYGYSTYDPSCHGRYWVKVSRERWEAHQKAVKERALDRKPGEQ